MREKGEIAVIEEKRNRGKKPKRLNASMMRLLIAGWLIPLVLLITSVFCLVSQRMDRLTRENIQESADTAAEICEMRLISSIQASRNASYIPEIKESWMRYLEDGNEQELYNGVYSFISQMYKYDENFLSTMVYFRENPEKVYYIYSSVADSDYDSVRFFRENARTEADALAEGIDTGIGFLTVKDHLYMIRNIVNRDFVPLATIVMELDQQVIFQSLKGIGWYEDSCVFFDGECVYPGSGKAVAAVPAAGSTRPQERSGSVYYDEKGRSFVSRVKMLEGHEIRYFVLLDHKAIHYERNSMMILVLLILLLTIPLAASIFRFLYRNVNGPVGRLVEAAREIEAGNYGFQIEPTQESAEFTYLTGAFNAMSRKLKTQFEQIYLEELALKDADIKALQSQINPHFLNNTLEIINWEARMNGNERVSSMIEALSTMLEATLNRKRQPMIPLSEELEYVDAYCYIIGQRFGDKLQFDRQIDESLLDRKVPRLIIQPIVENAVEHGICGRQGRIGIRIYRDGDRMRIEIVNDGVMTKEDREKIDSLLNEKEKPERSVSLGIYNVNKRLKIIYGEDCGLTIKTDRNGLTVSTITVRTDETMD